MTETTTQDANETVEVAFRIPGTSWKRRTFREGSAAEERFWAMAEAEGAEVRVRDDR